MSTPIFDFGRSMMWPTEAFTVYPEPRYFLMVFAFAGDSTTTRVLRKIFGAASDAELFALRPFALGGAFFAAVLAVAMVSWGGSRCRHSRFGSRPTPAAEEILPGSLVDEPLQLQLRQPAERLVGAKLRPRGENVHVHRPPSVEKLPDAPGRPVERLLGRRCNGRRAGRQPGRKGGVPAGDEMAGHGPTEQLEDLPRASDGDRRRARLAPPRERRRSPCPARRRAAR